MENYSFIYRDKDKYSLGEIFNDKLVDYQDQVENTILNNIYRARVKKYLKPMDSYILDIGEDRDCLLRKKDRKKDLRIGQDILVEVIELGRNNKMHEASQKISLRGKYLILIPHAKKVSYSKNLREEKIKLLKDNLSFDLKVRFRSSCRDTSLELIEEEFIRLKEEYLQINLEENRLPTPKLIYKASDVERYIDQKGLPIVSNDKDLSKKNGLIYDKDFNPSYSSLIQKDLSKFHDKYIYFNNTSFLILDRLETLTVIDINQGSEYQKRNKEDMSFLVNQASIDTICQAFRLLDIKKMVIIDFIRMNEYNRRTIKKLMEEGLKDYKIDAQVLGFSKMGLFELIVN